jgi:predicted DNA-binding transcriptional regulator YafY
MTTPGRMLQLLALLQSRREWSGAELAQRLEVTDRTVRRDVERLRDLGYPVDGITGTAGGYRLAAGRNLPPLLLDDEEAVAVAVGLVAATGTGIAGMAETSVRALAKLRHVLPARLRTRVAAVGDATATGPQRGAAGADPTLLALLAAACRDHELLAFDYRRRDGAQGPRRVEPYRLVTTYGFWHLLAFDPGRDGWRIFRLDRLTDPLPTGARFTPRELPFDPAEHVAAAVTRAPYRYTGRATVAAPAPAVLERLPAPLPGRVQAIDGHTCTVTLGADRLDLVLADLVALGADFTLEGSDELRAAVRDMGRRLQAAT